MRIPIVSVLLTSTLLLATGCVTSTPQSRISEHRETYRRFPSEVQRKISAGEVEIGFTEEMVMLALGKPGRKFTHAGSEGESEVWVYFKREPHVSIGFGVSSGGYSGVSTGVSMSTAANADDEVMRVVFHEEKLSSIETRTK